MTSVHRMLALAAAVLAIVCASPDAVADSIKFANPDGVRADNAPGGSGDYKRKTLYWDEYCGLTVTAKSHYPRADYAKVVHDLNPDGGGLGVQAYDKDHCRIRKVGDDEVDYRESLRFAFDDVVTLESATFNNWYHGTAFTSGAQIGVRVDDGARQLFDLSNPVLLDLTGTTFKFERIRSLWHYEWDGGVKKKVYDQIGNDFYVDSITFSKGQPVPEPDTLALLGLGLVAVGYTRRRSLRKR